MTNYIKLPVEFESDKKNYFDRECPNENCKFIFKINMDDWQDKIGEEVHCPMCGHIANTDEWYTEEQIKEIEKIAHQYMEKQIQQMLDNTFGKMAKATRNNKYCKIIYKPNRKISYINNPIGQREEWNLDIVCDKCGTRYSVIGSAYFCPCCGYNSVNQVFEDSMTRIEKMIESQSFMLEKLTEKYDKDIAYSMTRSLLESTVGDIVSAFQKFAKENLILKSKKDTSKVRVNDFQNIPKGNLLYKDHLNKDYKDCLNEDDLKYLIIMFQKRHILEHNNGIIDENYIKNSEDNTYSLGQRVIISENDVKQLLTIIKNLAQFLKK